uniref:Uncharacterized protein n=1 Tax=Ovis aries TaxID=9940 RepID=A0AC11CCS8_SHEEP
MAVTFQMLAVQQSTSHAIHSWHSRWPSCQRRPDSSCTRLSGMTRAATSTSEMAIDAIKLCGTRWNVRTRRMVASTSRFQANVAATRKPSKVRTSTPKTESRGQVGARVCCVEAAAEEEAGHTAAPGMLVSRGKTAKTQQRGGHRRPRVRPQQKPHLMTPCFWASSLQNCQT